jgi:hypothetical protein
MWIKVFCLASATFFIPCLPLSAAPSASINSTTTVTVEGYGTDVQSAIDNATQNALLNVAGAYISSDTTLETRTKITDGIRTYSKSFNERISQTSNGVIQDVVIQNVLNLGSQYKALAHVTVRTGELRTYVLELSEGKNTVSEGLFSQVRANLDGRKNLIQSTDDIFSPILDGRAIKFKVSKPIPFSNVPNNYRSDDYVMQKLRNVDNSHIVLIRVVASIDDEYLKKILDYLDFISVKKYPTDSEVISVSEKRDLGQDVVDFKSRLEIYKGVFRNQSGPIYVIPINNEDFILSKFCRSIGNNGKFSPDLTPRKITLTLTNREGFVSKRSLKYVEDQDRSEYQLVFEKNGKKSNIRSIREIADEMYVMDNSEVYPDMGWNIIGCNLGQASIYKYREIDFFVKMSDEELFKSTDMSIGLSNE